MKTNKVISKPLLAILATVLLVVIGAFFFFRNSNPIVNEFKAQATLYADSAVSGDYETVLKILDEAMVINFTPEAREAMLSEFEAVWSEEGFNVKSYKFKGINKLSESVYQLDAVFYSPYGDEDIFAPFYYFYNDKWQMAVNQFQIPMQLLDNIEYIKKENALAPNGLVVFE